MINSNCLSFFFFLIILIPDDDLHTGDTTLLQLGNLKQVILILQFFMNTGEVALDLKDQSC